MRRTIATRSVRSGYGEIDERSLPPNTLVAFAQRAGLTAEDGVGSSNSPFTTALIKHFPTPGLDVELALRRVRDEVLRATRNRQEPFKYGSLGGIEIALVATSTGAATTTKQVEPGGAKQLSEVAEAWDRTKDTTSIAVLEAFAARYKNTFYSALAKARIEDLKSEATKAERVRQAEERKRAEDARAEAEAKQKRLAMLQNEKTQTRSNREQKVFAALAPNGEGNLQVRWGATEAEAKQRAVEACRQVSNTCAGAGVTNRLDDVFVHYCCTEPRFGCATPPHATRERALQTVKKQMSSAGFSSCTVHAYYSARTGEKQ